MAYSPYCAQKVVNRWILPRFSALNAKTGLVLSRLFEFLSKRDRIISLFIFSFFSFFRWNQKFIPIFAESSDKWEF